jgi:(p)ppGpp synthase/HD superfamily hydrolase
VKDGFDSLGQLSATMMWQAAGHLSQQALAMVCRALEVASQVHAGQTRDDGTPYILHPLRVCVSLLQELEVFDAEMLCAALLHDVLEDGPARCPDLKSAFGTRVANIVAVLTRPLISEWSRERRNKEYYDRLQHADDDTKLIKLLDKLDNLRDAPNCPDLEKRHRTRREAEDFYTSLCATLRQGGVRETVSRLIRQEIESLAERSENVPQES